MFPGKMNDNYQDWGKDLWYILPIYGIEYVKCEKIYSVPYSTTQEKIHIISDIANSIRSKKTEVKTSN